MKKQRSLFQSSYLLLLAFLAIGCCAALAAVARNLALNPLLLVGIGICYGLADWYGVKLPTRRPESFIELTVADAVVVFGLLNAGATTLLPVLLASYAVRYLQRGGKQPLGYLFNTAHRALGITIWLGFFGAMGLPAFNGWQGALTMLILMVCYPIWTMFFFGLLISVGSGQPALEVFREKFLPTIWIDSMVVALGMFAAFLYASVPWFLVPLALLLVLAYRSIGAVARRLELTHEVEQLNNRLQELNQGLEQQVADRTADLQRALRVKDDFVAIVAHELRTPVASILGSLGILNDMLTTPDSPQARRLIELSYRNSERLTRMVNDILDVQRLSTDRVTFELQPIALPDVARHAVDALESYAAGLNVRIELERSADDCMVIADRERVTQIIVNLLSNACKFSPAGEAVRVKIWMLDQLAYLSVTDRGPGIPLEFQERLFEPFAQADTSSRRRHGGTGLGLYIAKAFAERMGGRIQFETQAGCGTTFTVALPLTETAHSKQLPESIPATAQIYEPALISG